MILFDDAKSVALYSAYVDTPQNIRKSIRNYVVCLACFVYICSATFACLRGNWESFWFLFGSISYVETPQIPENQDGIMFFFSFSFLFSGTF